MIKTYEKYIDKYKKDIIRDYFYGKNELLNKLYGFEDRGEFTIQVLDELLDLEKENQQLKKSIKLFTDDLANMTNKALLLEKQKDDVVEYIKENKDKTMAPYGDNEDIDYEVCLFEEDINEILRMLGEIE